MTIPCRCPVCREPYSLDGSLAGRREMCEKCRAIMVVPELLILSEAICFPRSGTGPGPFGPSQGRSPTSQACRVLDPYECLVGEANPPGATSLTSATEQSCSSSASA